MAKDKNKEAEYRAEYLRRMPKRKERRKEKRREKKRIYGPDGHRKCDNCDGFLRWCQSCGMYSRSCCVEYGTCQCS